jgi:hypothetical protein
LVEGVLVPGAHIVVVEGPREVAVGKITEV